MEKLFSSALGTGLVILALSGFVKNDEPKHLLGLLNVDKQHSVLRFPLIAALFYASSGQAKLKYNRNMLSFVGLFYLAMGTIGSVDKKVGGVLPSKLTNFDIVYHLATGASALWLGKRSGRMMKE